jgi:hypothetical protein
MRDELTHFARFKNDKNNDDDADGSKTGIYDG